MISTLPANLSAHPAVAPYAIVAPSVPLTSSQAELCVKQVLALFQDGFQWKDLADIISIAQHSLNDFPTMTIEDKRTSIIQILDLFIDLTDTPFLPDNYTDPLFKAMVPPFVQLLISDKTTAFIPFAGHPSSASIQQAAHDTLDAFKDGFQWQDLARVTEFALEFATHYHELTGTEKAAVANEFIDFVIDETDTPYMIDAFSDPIFKSFIHPIVNAFFHAT